MTNDGVVNLFGKNKVLPVTYEPYFVSSAGLDHGSIAKINEVVPEAVDVLMVYRSGPTECSIAKGIPATPEMIALIKKAARIVPLKIRYRGPRRPTTTGQSTCLQKDATTFAVYHRTLPMDN